MNESPGVGSVVLRIPTRVPTGTVLAITALLKPILVGPLTETGLPISSPLMKTL